MRLNTTLLLVSAVMLACGGGEESEAPSSRSNPRPATNTLTGATPATSPDLEDEGAILATVGSVTISEREFQTAASRRPPSSGSTLSEEEKREVLDRLISEKLLYLRAVEEGLEQDPKVQKVMINTLLRDRVYSTVRNADFEDDVLRAYYDTHRDEFIIPEKIQLKRSLIRVNDDRTAEEARAEAQRIHAEIAEDPSRFRQLASEFSEGPYKRRGGDIGYVGRDGKAGLDQDVVERGFELDEGQLSEVFETDDGFNVIFVNKRRARVERSFQQVKGAVLRKLKNERLKELYNEFVEGLREVNEVTVNEILFEAVEVSPGPQLGGLPGRGPAIGPGGGPSLPQLQARPPGATSGD